MSARARQDRVVVALAAVACGRLSRAETVHASRGQCSATADQYRVQVTEPGVGVARRRRARDPRPTQEVVLEHWGGDAEMLTLRAPVADALGLAGPLERARVAARSLNYYDLDSLRITYTDGSELRAGRTELTLYGAPQGLLRRRRRLLRAAVSELV